MHYQIDDQIVTARVLEELTGVSINLQHAWRNRGSLPPLQSGRAGYSATEVCKIEIMRTLADRGVTVKAAGLIAVSLGHDVRAHLVRVKPGLVEFRGTPLPTHERLAIIAEAFPPRARFAVLTPADDPEAATQLTMQTADLDGLSAALDHGAPSAVVLDLQAIAARIADRAMFPLVILTEVEE